MNSVNKFILTFRAIFQYFKLHKESCLILCIHFRLEMELFDLLWFRNVSEPADKNVDTV